VGVPSTDIGSGGPYGVYHSVFDNYAWYTMTADPHFIYLQEMARVCGLEALRMADTDVLPYDYVNYAREIESYLETAKKRAYEYKLGAIDFTPAELAASHLSNAGQRIRGRQFKPGDGAAKINSALRDAETALINPAGLPNRSWYRHTIYAPGEYTGYAAVVIPGVNEAIDAHDPNRTRQQLDVLAKALNNAAQALNSGE
jgi:N-acetylated-alpha-linked acidic dipeptidase